MAIYLATNSTIGVKGADRLYLRHQIVLLNRCQEQVEQCLRERAPAVLRLKIAAQGQLKDTPFGIL
jgi:hypothetical protein